MAKPKADIATLASGPLTTRQLENMLMVLVRNEELLKLAKSRLELSYFTDNERLYAVLWSTALGIYEATGCMPTKSSLKAEIEAVMQVDSSWTDQHYARMEFIIGAVFSATIGSAELEYAKCILTKFLRQRLTCHVSRILGDNPHSEASKDILDEAVRKASDIEIVQSGGIDEPFAENWEPAPLNARLTRIPCIDNFLRIGDAAGESYLLLGPYGSCKTTLMVQLSVLRAQQCHEDWIEAGCPKDNQGKVYVFFYEGNKQEYLLRALSTTAQIDRTRLEDFAEKKTKLSTSDTLLDYEKRMFAKKLAHGAKIFGETERRKAAQEWLNPHWRVVDMTGNDKRHKGTNLEADIISSITADLETNGGYCAGVYVDYLLAAAKRHCAANGKDPTKHLRHIIPMMPLNLVNDFGVAHKCPIWCASQLAGAANASAPGRVHDHSDGAEAKNIAEHVAFSFQISKLTHENLAVMRCSKHRRSPPVLDAVIRLDGAMSTVYDVSNQYSIDSVSKTIVSKREADRVVSASSFMKKPVTNEFFHMGGT